MQTFEKRVSRVRSWRAVLLHVKLASATYNQATTWPSNFDYAHSGAIGSGAQLASSDLRGHDLSEVDLSDVNLSFVTFDQTTKWPPSLKRPRGALGPGGHLRGCDLTAQDLTGIKYSARDL